MANMPADKAAQKKKKNRQVFMIYCVWNIIRYMIIAVLILLANKRNVKEINKYKEFCCDCYYVAKNPVLFKAAEERRFDLSYCIPDCADCNYCETYFGDKAQSAFNYNGTVCPMLGYEGGNRPAFNWDWDSQTGCWSHISYTSFSFFAKSYTAYGIWSVVTSSFYSLALIGIMCYVYMTPNLVMILLRWILIYNILISEIFLYLVFKPFQYYKSELSVGTQNKSIVCQINSIHDITSSVISVTIYLSVGFMVLHFMYMLYRICGYCILCIKSRQYSNRMRQYSVDVNEMDKQRNYGTDNANFNFSFIKHRCRWTLCGICVGLLMAFFLGVGIYATYRMIQYGHKDYDDWKITVISFVMPLLFLSLIDNPWLLLKIKLFCCRTKSKLQNNYNEDSLLHSL